MATIPVRIRSIVRGLLAVVTLIVFVLSTHINVFMGFFYVADRFPLVMSLLTGLTLFVTAVLDALKAGDVVTSCPGTEIGILFAFFILWTAANGFSTPRWNAIQPSTCSAITVQDNPAFESASRVWCHEILGLRGLVWVEWVLLGGSLVALLAYCIKQTKRGSRHIWSTPLALYDPNMASPNKWSAQSRIFSRFSFHTPGETSAPYPFAPQQHPYKVSTPKEANPKHFSLQSQGSGQAVMGYQLDPFNVPKERSISFVSSAEEAVQLSSWRTFAEQGLDQFGHRMKGQEGRYHHAYTTSIDHHPSQAYAY